MSLSNLSQVLVRNIDLLESSQPLLINFPVDDLAKEWLTHFPQSQLTYFTNNKLDADQLARKALNQHKIEHVFGSAYQTEKVHDLVIIAFPKSKNELAYSLAMINAYLAEDARLLFVGENKGGIKSVAKLAKDYVDNCTKVDSARHCILFEGNHILVDKPFIQDDWFHYYPVAINDIELTIAALPGVFSQQGLDKGTRILLENLPKHYNGSMLDFGCGAGIISAFIGKQYPDIEFYLLDISALAVTSAEKTLAINKLKGHTLCSDGLTEVSTSFDHIISNPPFHQGLKTHYHATETFLKTCRQHLTKNGTLTVVANSFLQYRPIMEQSVGKTELVINDKGFNVLVSQS